MSECRLWQGQQNIEFRTRKNNWRCYLNVDYIGSLKCLPSICACLPSICACYITLFHVISSCCPQSIIQADISHDESFIYHRFITGLSQVYHRFITGLSHHNAVLSVKNIYQHWDQSVSLEKGHRSNLL